MAATELAGAQHTADMVEVDLLAWVAVEVDALAGTDPAWALGKLRERVDARRREAVARSLARSRARLERLAADKSGHQRR